MIKFGRAEEYAFHRVVNIWSDLQGEIMKVCLSAVWAGRIGLQGYGPNVGKWILCWSSQGQHGKDEQKGPLSAMYFSVINLY